MPTATLYRNQCYVCDVMVQRGAKGIELRLSPSRNEIEPGGEDFYQIHHRGRMMNLKIVENFTFGAETFLRVEIYES